MSSFNECEVAIDIDIPPAPARVHAQACNGASGRGKCAMILVTPSMG